MSGDRQSAAQRMTRQHALHQLLRLGPMRFHEIVSVCGWHPNTTWNALSRLRDCDQVLRLPSRGARSFPTYVALDAIQG